MVRRSSRLLSVLIVASALALSTFPASPTRASALARTPAEIRDAIDARLAQLWPVVQDKEAKYFAAHGHYWQGLRTHTLLPADGNLALPDVGETTPTDQLDPWPEAIKTIAIEMALVIDVYDGPFGQGYVASAWVMINGRTFVRSAQVGPETWRVEGWHEVTIEQP